MELTDIMPREKWVELQQELSAKFGLNADVVDKHGKKLAGSAWGNDLCRTLHDDEKGFGAVCAPAGALFTQLSQAGEPFSEECDGGMMRVSVPVKKDGELLGSVGGCGLLPEGEEVDTFTIDMMSDLEEKAIGELAGTVHTASEAKVKAIQAFIQQRIDEALD